MRDYMFQVNSKDLKVILSEVVSSKSANKDQRIPKQIGSTLSTISPGVTPELINDFFTDYNLKSFKGEDGYNNMLSEYLAGKDPKLMRPLIDNMDKIGTSQLAEALTEPGFGDFQVEAYRKMMRINKESKEMAIEEGETSEKEYGDVMKEMNEYTSVSDRNFALAGDHISVFLNKMNNPYREAILKNYIVHQITRPKAANSVASRMRVFDYGFQDDPITKRLNTEKDIYFLDDGHKKKLANYDNIMANLKSQGFLKSQIDAIKKAKNYGELWDIHQNPNTPAGIKAEISKFFEALTTRVPIDSISGTAALNFGGFTGRKGFGGLIHGEVMRKLGGADADGDKMWLFMDVKSKYKDVYKQNKDEFLRYYKKSQYGQKGKKDVLTPEEFNELSKGVQPSKAPQVIGDYSKYVDPGWDTMKAFGRRMKVIQHLDTYKSKGTKNAERQLVFDLMKYIEGFNPKTLKNHKISIELEKIVKTLKKAGYKFGWDANEGVFRIVAPDGNAWSNRPKGAPRLKQTTKKTTKVKGFNPDDWYEGTSDNKEAYRKDFTVTTGSNIGLRRSPSLMYSINHRKTISDIAADGRNRLGPAVVAKQNLIALYTDKIQELEGLEEKVFDVDVGDKLNTSFTVRLKTGKKALKDAMEKLRASIAFPSDPLDEIGIVNNDIYFSKMFESLFEVTSAKSKKGKIPVEKVTSLMKRKAIQNYSNINSAYYGKNVADNRQWRYHERKQKADFIHNIPAESRVSIITKQADTLKDVDWQDGYQKRVNLDSVQSLYADYNEEVRSKKNKEVAKAFYRGGFTVPFNKQISRYLQGRLEGDNLKQAEDFFSNDLQVMTGYKTGIEYWRQLPKEKLQEIALELDEISKGSYLLNRESEGSYEYTIKPKKGENITINQAQKEKLDKAKIEYEILDEKPLPKKTQSLNQAETDALITKYKDTLSPIEQDAFDSLLLSGFRIPYANELKSFYDLRNKKDRSFIEDVAMEATGKNIYSTGVNRLGFSSKAVSDKIITDYWNNYKKLFNESSDPISESLKKDLFEISNQMREPVNVKVENSEIKADLGEGREAQLENLRTLDKIPAFRRVAENKSKGRVSLTSENQKLYNEILEHLDFYGPSIGLKLEGYMKHLFHKSPDSMTIEDMRAFNHLLGSRRSGDHLGWLGKQFVKWTKGDPLLSKYFYNTFPMTSDRAWLRKDFKLVERIGMFWNPLERKAETGIVYKPAHAMGQLNYSITNLGDFSTHEKRKKEDNFRNEMQFLNAIPEAQELAELATYQRELPLGLKLDAFKASDLSMNAKARTYGIKNGKLQNKILERIASVDKKVYNVRFGNKSKDMTGQEIMDKINKIYSKHSDGVYKKWLRGNPKTLAKYIYRDENGVEQANLDLFAKDMMDAIKENIAIDKVLDIGVDGMNRIGTHLQLKMTNNPKLKGSLRRRLDEIGTKYRKDFFPHVNHEGKHIEKALKSAMEDLANKSYSNTTREGLISKAAALSLKMRNVTDEFSLETWKQWGIYDDIKQRIKEKTADIIDYDKSVVKSGHQMSRELHIPGYDRSPVAMETYTNNVVDAYYKNAAQIISRMIVDNFEVSGKSKYTDKKGKITDKSAWDNIEAWTNHYKLYVNRAMGYPDIIPEYMINNPKMALKGTPYLWFADSTVKNRINKIAKKMGLGNKDVPEELQDIMTYDKLKAWSNMEAKFELATLLAHPKTAIANIFGGTTMTIQSVGLRHWNKTRDIKWLSDNINTNWKSKEDTYKWVESLGVIEEFLRKEIGLSDHAKDKKVRDGLELLVRKIKKDPSVDDKTLKDVWKRSGLSDSLFNKAAYFMRISERRLRRDAFLAHYIQARDIFKGAVDSPEHPFLIWWAKRGVKDTQFLYNAANRPAFAATNVGKIVSRFQLWAWNSVAFRNMVYKEAKERGYQKGTREFERFKRVMSTDMMLFALANVFTYSLFENTLPAPLNWMQDLGDWVFGSEKERDRAFFGSYPTAIAPLQMITPPAMRLVGPTFKAMLDDDWSRMSDYYAMTMIPFGRLARDVKIAAENPIQTVERMTGLPYIKMHKFVKEQREEE
jgi:hypothetical protein